MGLGQTLGGERNQRGIKFVTSELYTQIEKTDNETEVMEFRSELQPCLSFGTLFKTRQQV